MLVVNLVRVQVLEPKCCGYASAPRPVAVAGVHKEGGAVKISPVASVINAMVCGRVGRCKRGS